MGDVVGLREDSVFTHGEPCEDLIAALEELTAAARSGSLRAIAYISVSNERAITINWEGHCDQHDMIAGVGMLSHRFLNKCDLDAH